MLTLIKDKPRSAAMNMAIDETLFDELQNGACLRVYLWDKAYTTIGYFQANDCNAVRRLTGGLRVDHKDDISYGFCANADDWKCVYNQEETYKYLHAAIKKALESIGYDCNFSGSNSQKQALCVKTLYADDLLLDGKKVVGSCMRRRGKKILVQGSVHLKLTGAQRESFTTEFAKNLAAVLNTSVKVSHLTVSQLQNAEALAKEKYSSLKWNNKL